MKLHGEIRAEQKGVYAESKSCSPHARHWRQPVVDPDHAGHRKLVDHAQECIQVVRHSATLEEGGVGGQALAQRGAQLVHQSLHLLSPYLHAERALQREATTRMGEYGQIEKEYH
jgi:hypothetical protein